MQGTGGTQENAELKAEDWRSCYPTHGAMKLRHGWGTHYRATAKIWPLTTDD